MLSALFLLALNGPLHIESTEIFQVMLTNEVLVQPNGEVYVVNFDESRVQYYGADGGLKKNIGGRGKGPGEFTYPGYVAVAGDHLYVYDILSEEVSRFSTDGEFKDRIKPSARQAKLGITNGGWFFWQESALGEEDVKSSLQWANHAFENPKVIKPIEELGWASGTSMSSDGVNRIASYSPLNVRPSRIVSPDGSRFYFADALAFHIDVYDGKTGKLLHVIKGKDKPVPFDEDWADEKYKPTGERIGKRYPDLKVDKLYPEFFPAIRSMAFDPAGNLVVDRWRGRPDDNHHPIAFDATGKETPMAYPWKVIKRLAGAANGHAYLIMFDDDEAGISRVPMAEAAAFVDKYPVSDWSTSRSISISN